MPYSRAPGIPGNENDHSRIPGNEKTPPGMNSLVASLIAPDQSLVFCTPFLQYFQHTVIK